MTWGQGYTTDLHYLSSFFDAVAPAHMRMVQLLKGQRPPDINRPYRCLELGSGSGIGMAILAAANPHAEFVALDYNPGHIAAGRRFSDTAGLSNARFYEANFIEVADTARQIWGEFDFIICHGVYSWVAPAVRAALLRVIDQCAAPGCLVFFGYNSLPGWLAVAPLQKLLFENSRRLEGRSDERLQKSFEFARTLKDLNAKYLDLDEMPSVLRPRFDGTENYQYLAHEYLTENWTPDYHCDVARILSDEAKLDFIGSATITDLFVEMVATPEQQAFLKTLPAGVFREQIKDYFSPQMYRRDIYARGASLISDDERTRRLRNEVVALAIPREHFSYEVSVRIGKAELPRAPYEAIVEALSSGPRPLGDLVDAAARAGSPLSVEEIAGILLGSSRAVSLPAPNAPITAALKRFNMAIADFALNDVSAHKLAIAATRTQNGIHLSRFEFLVYMALVREGDQFDAQRLAQSLVDLCRENNEMVLKDDKPVTDPNVQLEMLLRFIREELPSRHAHWRRVGAI